MKKILLLASIIVVSLIGVVVPTIIEPQEAQAAACNEPIEIDAGTTGSVTVLMQSPFSGACKPASIINSYGITFDSAYQGSEYCSNGAIIDAYATENYNTTAYTSITDPTTLTFTMEASSDTGGECEIFQTTVDITIMPVAGPSPDFTAACSPATATITAGSSTSFNYTTTGSDGFSSAVTVSASFSPSGGTLPTVSYSNNGVAPNAVTSATIATTSSTTPATYTVTLSGTGGGITKTCNVELVVNAPVPTATILANGSAGSTSIAYGASAALTWSSTNATSCSVSPIGASGTSGSQSTGALTTTQTYTLSCTGPGGSANSNVIVNVGAPNAPVADIQANGSNGPITITYNSTATISWTSTDTTSCTATSSPAGFSSSGTSNAGTASQAITAATTFTVNCTGPGGNTSDSVVVNVPAPDFSFTCTPATVTITAGSSTSFNLSTTPANGFNSAVTFSTVFSPSSGTLPTVSYTNNGAVPSATTTLTITTSSSTTPATYSITVTGTGSSLSRNCSGGALELIVNSPAPTANIQANGSDGPVTVSYGGTATISWTSTNTTSCTATSSPAGFSSSGTSNAGTASQAITASTTFTVNCTGPGGNTSDSVVVNVPGESFSAACAPASVSIAAGSSTAFNISTTGANGFSSAVTFTHSFTPSGGTLPTISYTNNGAVPNATTSAVVSTTVGTTPATYTIIFSGTGGASSAQCSSQLIVSAPSAPNPPTAVTASNSGTVLCSTIGVTWTKSATGATPTSFKVYRSATGNGVDWQQVGAEIPYTTDTTYSFTDTTPLAPSGSNYYSVSALLGAAESAKTSASPVVPIACAPNISLSDKDVIQVNSTTASTTAINQPCNNQSDLFTLPSSGIFKSGDVIRFRINVCNSGNQTLTGVRVVDTLTNMNSLTYISSSNDCVASFDSGTRTFTLNDLEPASGGSATVCAITLSAVVTSPGGPEGSLYRFLNSASIVSDQLSRTVQTPPYLYSVGSGPPSRIE